MAGSRRGTGWDDQGLHVEIERIEDLGETVLALLTMQGRGEQSGVDVATKWAHAITFSSRDQRIRSYASWEAALEAVGLRD